MRVTIKDIAKEANVSHSTVSRALHNHPAIPKTTIKNIKSIAERMGYIPSAAARKLKTQQSKAIGVILNNIGDPFWSDVIQGIDEILQSANFSIFLATTDGDKVREKEVVQAMVQHGVDGVIVCAPQFSPEQNLVLLDYGLPMVFVNSEGDYSSQPMVSNDDEFGSGLATRHLIELGHQRIAYIGVSGERRTNKERERGFREEMRIREIPVDEDLIIYGAAETPAEGYKAAVQLLLIDDRPTAIVCYNDFLATGVFSALFNSGVRIPHDISVVGFDDIEISQYLTPPLTTVRQYKSTLGSIVATTMLQHLVKLENQSSQDQPERISVRGTLIIRGSTIDLSPRN